MSPVNDSATDYLRKRAEKLAERPAVKEYLDIKAALEKLEADAPAAGRPVRDNPQA